MPKNKTINHPIFGEMQVIDMMEGKPADYVVCDQCNTDYTMDNETCGGFIFSSHGVCPKCADRFLKDIKRYNEQAYIRSWCPPDKTHKQFILDYRRGITYPTPEDL